ncbi:MAG: hypothetical protein ABIF92_00200 [archaeon]
MDWKKFFKVTETKTIFTFGGMILGLYKIWPACQSCPGVISCGFPFPYLTQVPKDNYMTFSIAAAGLFLNIVFWYLLACITEVGIAMAIKEYKKK